MHKNGTKSTAVLNCVRIHVKRLEKDGEINMKKWIRFCSLLMAAMLLFMAMPLAAAAAADADAPVDFVLVLDCSASIFQNDTQRLSINAVQSFIDQMPVQNARVGVIGFGYRATMTHMLTLPSIPALPPNWICAATRLMFMKSCPSVP